MWPCLYYVALGVLRVLYKCGNLEIMQNITTIQAQTNPKI